MNISEGNASGQMSALEKNLLGVRVEQIFSLVPGFLVACLLAWLSILLADFIGVILLGFPNSPVSAVMVAILLGSIISALIPLPRLLKPGLTFAVKKILRLGIIMLGIRLTIFSVLALGARGVPIVLFCILCALFITTCINKWLGLSAKLGTLIAVGTSICGVSAIVATGPAIDAEDEEVAYAVAVITIFGLFATLFYPYLANVLFRGEPMRVGLFLGTSVHDTSQVIGSAKVYADVFVAPLALDVAMITKLVRNVFMAVVIPFMSFYYTHKSSDRGKSTGKDANPLSLFPLFVLGFLAFVVIRSIGDAGINVGRQALGMWDSQAWGMIHRSIQTWAGRLLVVALAGVGLNTDFRSFRKLGGKPFLVGLAAALIVGGISFLTISFAYLIRP